MYARIQTVMTGLLAGLAPILVSAATPPLDPARFLPPDSVAYLELGSPGRQVERLLGLIPGIPDDPAPAWMEDLKALRGMGIGWSDMSASPHMLVVLYPQDHEAVRRSVEHLLGAALEPAGTAQTYSLFQGGGRWAAAVDEDLILLADSSELLQFALDQALSGGSASSLADVPNGLAGQTDADRSDRLVTGWIDAATAYDQCADRLGADLPARWLGLNALLGLDDLKEVVGIVRLEEVAVRIRIEAQHATEADALVYDLVRTLARTADGLKAIPDLDPVTIPAKLGESARNTLETMHHSIGQWTDGRIPGFRKPEPLETEPPVEDPPPPTPRSVNLGALIWLPRTLGRWLEEAGSAADPSWWGPLAQVLAKTQLTLHTDEADRRVAADLTLVPVPELRILLNLLDTWHRALPQREELPESP